MCSQPNRSGCRWASRAFGRDVHDDIAPRPQPEGELTWVFRHAAERLSDKAALTAICECGPTPDQLPRFKSHRRTNLSLPPEASTEPDDENSSAVILFAFSLIGMGSLLQLAVSHR